MELYKITNLENRKEIRDLAEDEAKNLLETLNRPWFKMEKQEGKTLQLNMSPYQYKLFCDMLNARVVNMKRDANSKRRASFFGKAERIDKDCEQLINLKNQIQEQWQKQ